MIMRVSQNEQKEESALLFGKMLSECGQNKDYIRAVSSKGEYY
jgi:hypothetical protein